jgi:hypothetical protein
MHTSHRQTLVKNQIRTKTQMHQTHKNKQNRYAHALDQVMLL